MISIIIPVYNVKKYLDTAMNSLKDLRFDYEILLVDDGSSDGSALLCDGYAKKDKRVQVIHQKNGGLSAARNTGMMHASGDYFLFLDADDSLDGLSANSLVSKIDGQAEIIMGLYEDVYEDGAKFKEHSDYFLSLNGTISMDDFLKDFPFGQNGCYLPAWRFVVKKEFIFKHRLFFKPGILHEDEEWVNRLFYEANQITITHDYFYHYLRNRAGSIMATPDRKHFFDTYDILAGLLENLDPGKTIKNEFRVRRAGKLFLNLVLDLHQLSDEDQKQMLEKLSRHPNLLCPTKKGQIVNVMRKVFGSQKGIELTSSLNGIRKRRGK